MSWPEAFAVFAWVLGIPLIFGVIMSGDAIQNWVQSLSKRKQLELEIEQEKNRGRELDLELEKRRQSDAESMR